MKRLLFLLLFVPMLAVGADSNVVIPGSEKVYADETGRVTGYSVDMRIHPYGRFTIKVFDDEMPFPVQADGSFSVTVKQEILDRINKKAATIRARNDFFANREALRREKTEEATAKGAFTVQDVDVNKPVIIGTGVIEESVQ